MMRLDRYLVTLGVGTRTEVQKLIRRLGRFKMDLLVKKLI